MIKFFDLIGKGGPMAIVIILVLIALVGGFVYWRIRRNKKHNPKQKAQAIDAVKLEPEIKPAELPTELVKKVRGTGNYKAMVICKDIIDFTTIPEPIGEIYQFDPSCPMRGGGYIVKEQADGTLVDYDPRELSVIVEETPEYAWFATHWPVVKRVFNVPVQWWKSTAMWHAAGLMVIVFISALVVLGGD